MSASASGKQAGFVVLGIQASSAEGERFAPDEQWDQGSQDRLEDLLQKARTHAKQRARREDAGR
jgi:hypothetical protein